MSADGVSQEQRDDEGVCTEFTTDHGLVRPDSDGFLWAFVCPKCEKTNPLEGEPQGFKNKPFRCTGCNWVSLLSAEAIEEFVAENEVPV